MTTYPLHSHEGGGCADSSFAAHGSAGRGICFPWRLFIDAQHGGAAVVVVAGVPAKAGFEGWAATCFGARTLLAWTWRERGSTVAAMALIHPQAPARIRAQALDALRAARHAAGRA